MNSRLDPRVVVAGGGALGSVVALALARAGARVTLADPSAPGANASGVAAGMLAPAFESLFDEESPPLGLLRAARDLWPALASSVGLRLSDAGAMAVGAPDKVEAWAAALADLGVKARRLTPAEAQGRSPWLSAGWGAVCTNEDWRLEPAAALASLRAEAEDRGVVWRAEAVTDFVAGEATLSGGGRLPCEALVVATGASTSLAGVASELVALTPVKGHILRAPALALRGPVVRLEGVYVCPAAEGALVGSTMEFGRADDAIDPRAVGRLRALAAAASPAFADTPLVAHAGVRAATPGGLPWVGAARAPGVWLAVGARRNGWLLAPLIAEALVENMIHGRRTPWADAFDPTGLTRADLPGPNP